MNNSPQDAVTIAVLQAEVVQLRDEVKELSDSTRALVEAWNAAGGIVKFVKWLSTLVAAIGTVYLFVKHGFTAKAGG